ncbi:polyamine ABC transporter ATP-binding protein [Zavarzinia compransoris]|uniref:ABC transporter ATP-binding protein n=1 Tax=Zavarzinia marina TaxID=2911065 RepID=UPI001F226B67|nr:polyamine ABC transporter ATP-binding protein [Zavarzinia marina]MCF4167499.1 polyamine ABC transporter ATP-binding protein [Zavarzinia marina]
MNTATAARVPFEPWKDPQAKPYIRIVNVTKTFGDFVAVDNLSIDIYQREFFSLLGPSGCGKTTLLRMLAGFERPTSGRIELDGVDMSTVPPYERPVNMMFQSYALFPHMTVEENIAFGLRQDRVPKDERNARVEEMLGLVQLSKFAKRKPHQLSGGQRQRVALARSLVKKPKMLLLDEPLGALDKKLREQTQFELMNIQEQVGITFVIVTHDQEEAMTVSSRIAVMNHGRIAQVATPTEIYEFPNSRYVAEFIGDVNVFEGRLSEAAADHVRIAPVGGGGEIYVDRGTSAAQGATVWAAIRPEKIDVALTPPTDPSVNCIEGTVWDIGYLGNLTIYHVRLADGRKMTAAVANRTRLREQPITWDDTVYLTWAPDSAVVLVS